MIGLRRPAGWWWSAGLRAVAAGAVVPRLVATSRAPQGVEAGEPPAATGDVPSISVVIPARDEADRVAPLLIAIHGAPGVSEVVVVDDRSSDDTAAVARRHGAVVVSGQEPPPGWAGKTWALDQGVRAASGEWVVCLDADTRPSPDLVHSLVARAVTDGADLASVSGVADLPPAARWLHASMLASLVYRYGGPGAAVGDRVLVNGQCLAFRRQALLAEGGFAVVAGAVTEDVALARVLARRGWSVRLYDMGERLMVEPYRSVRDVWTGWGRSIGLPGVEAKSRIALEVAVLLAAMVLPVCRAARRRADLLDAGLLAVRLGTLFGTRRAYRAGGAAYWLSPLADGAAVVAVARSATQRTVSWRGRRLPVG